MGLNINKLKELIKLRKMNQRDLAEQAGLSVTTVNHALARGDLKVSMLEKFAKVLDVPINYFFTEGDKVEITGSQIQVGDSNIIGENRELLVENELLKERINGLNKEVYGLNKEVEYLKEMLEMVRNLKK